MAAVGLFILFKQKAMKVCWLKKENLSIAKDWSRIGVFSDVQQFIANIVYALMSVKMVKLVFEFGNY